VAKKKAKKKGKSLKKVKPLVLPTKKTKPASDITDYISMFYGPPGVGKTTFVNDMGDVLFLSTDRGTRFIEAMREEISTVSKLERVFKALETKGAADNYDMVCVDHVDDFCTMLEDHVLDKLRVESLGDAGWGKGWKMYRKIIALFLRRLKALNLGITFIAHETIKTVRSRGQELERTMPAMSKSAWGLIIPVCDIVGYCGFKTIKKGGKRKEIRTVECEPREDLYAKDRTDRDQPEKGWERLDGAKFVETFE